ncbi:MAG: tetratricopeptide repeat protein [Phenylobacterium sp.]|nr:tetratricopeptide repeat protein [Phenylobacterium sp.]
MTKQSGIYSVRLMGAFRLEGKDGARVEVASRKSIGLIALLATGRDGERTRQFLQDKLWGSRESSQAQTSLRRELANLRKLLADQPEPFLIAVGARVRLNLPVIRFDIPVPGAANENDPPPPRGVSEFLEGLDIPGEEGFEDWLREQRTLIHTESVDWEAAPQSYLPLPRHVLDLSQPAPGFEGRPAVAVLKFQNLTGDPALDFAAEGISEDLIDQLCRLRWLPVIARNSSFIFRPEDLDPKSVGQSLGARYLVEGRLRSIGENFRLTVSAIDTESAQVVWTKRLDLPGSLSNTSLAPLLDDLTAILAAKIDHAEQSRAVARPATSRDVNTLIWKCRWHLNRMTRRDSEIARDFIEEALRLEPENPEVLVQAAWRIGWSHWAERVQPADMQAWSRLAREAMRADPEDGRAYAILGAYELLARNNERSRSLCQQAIGLNPSLPLGHAMLGSGLSLAGRPDEAIQSLLTAMRLSPNDPFAFHTLGELATAYWMADRWRDAVDLAEQSLIRRPAYWLAHLVKVNALLAGGDVSGATAAAQAMRAHCHGFREGDIDWLPFVDSSWNSNLKDGLRKALQTEGPGRG